MYGITNESNYTPENFFAGDYPIAKDFGATAESPIVRHEPVKIVDGAIVPVTLGTASEVDTTNAIPAKTAEESTVEGLYGIAAGNAAAGEEVTVYLTGEFFANSLPLQNGVTAAVLKPAFRKLGIFLKGDEDNA